MSKIINVDFKNKKKNQEKSIEVYQGGYDFKHIMKKALFLIYYDTIEMIMKYGIPDKHKIIITFRTQDDGVILSDDMKEKHPTLISVILQHQYKNIKIDGNGFLVDLSFNGRWQTVRIPFESIIELADPEMQVVFRDNNE